MTDNEKEYNALVRVCVRVYVLVLIIRQHFAAIRHMIGTKKLEQKCLFVRLYACKTGSLYY